MAHASYPISIPAVHSSSLIIAKNPAKIFELTKGPPHDATGIIANAGFGVLWEVARPGGVDEIIKSILAETTERLNAAPNLTN